MPECTVLEYAVKLQISNAKLQLGDLTNEALLKIIKDGYAKNNEKLYELQFKGDLGAVNDALRDFMVKPDCPFNEAVVNIVIQAAGKNGAEANGQRVAVEAGQHKDLDGAGTHEIIDKDFKIPIKQGESEKFKIRGQVLSASDGEDPLSDVKVSIKMAGYDGCPARQVQSDEDGFFTILAQKLQYNWPYTISVSPESELYNDLTRNVVVGGAAVADETLL